MNDLVFRKHAPADGEKTVAVYLDLVKQERARSAARTNARRVGHQSTPAPNSCTLKIKNSPATATLADRYSIVRLTCDDSTKLCC